MRVGARRKVAFESLAGLVACRSKLGDDRLGVFVEIGRRRRDRHSQTGKKGGGEMTRPTGLGDRRSAGSDKQHGLFSVVLVDGT